MKPIMRGKKINQSKVLRNYIDGRINRKGHQNSNYDYFTYLKRERKDRTFSVKIGKNIKKTQTFRSENYSVWNLKYSRWDL